MIWPYLILLALCVVAGLIGYLSAEDYRLALGFGAFVGALWLAVVGAMVFVWWDERKR